MSGQKHQRLAVADLPRKAATAFELRPDAEALGEIAERLDLLGLRKLSFQGQVKPAGKTDWLLTGELGATVVQPCSVTLAPVTTRLDEPVSRRFTPHLPDETDQADDEVEMPEDDTLEPLGSHIDLDQVMEEALALALPLYPRADGAEAGKQSFTEPGKTAMTDDEAKPFAGLADLMARMPKKDDDSRD